MLSTLAGLTSSAPQVFYPCMRSTAVAAAKVQETLYLGENEAVLLVPNGREGVRNKNHHFQFHPSSCILDTGG